MTIAERTSYLKLPFFMGALRVGVEVVSTACRKSLSFNGGNMCRNIKTLFNFEPPATELEIRNASLQFVRKLSGFSVPSKANEAELNRRLKMWLLLRAS